MTRAVLLSFAVGVLLSWTLGAWSTAAQEPTAEQKPAAKKDAKPDEPTQQKKEPNDPEKSAKQEKEPNTKKSESKDNLSEKGLGGLGFSPSRPAIEETRTVPLHPPGGNATLTGSAPKLSTTSKRSPSASRI